MSNEGQRKHGKYPLQCLRCLCASNSVVNCTVTQQVIGDFCFLNVESFTVDIVSGHSSRPEARFPLPEFTA